MGDFVDSTYLQSTCQTHDLVALTNNDGSNASTINTDVLDAVIEDAEAIAKGYIQSKYSLPFSTVPTIIKKLTKDLVVYYLYERKTQITDRLQVLYENTIDQLKAISTGKIVLDTEPGENVFQSEDMQSLVFIGSEEVPFTEDDLKGFV